MHMEKVILDGVQYVKASVVAADFKYTPDYIGQLCRGKKVDARLVGRTWFVNPNSLIDHKKAKFAKPDTRPKNADIANEVKVSRTVVEPVLRSKTSKFSLDSTSLVQASTPRRLHVSYDLDDESLFPTIVKKKTAPPRTIRIVAAGAKKIAIKKVGQEINFKPDMLPEVSLSGKLAITSYPSIKAPKDAELSPLVSTVSVPAKPLVKTTPKVSISAPNSFSKISKKIAPTVSAVAREEKLNVSLAPRVAKVNPASNPSVIVLLYPLISTFLAIVCVGLLFSASSLITASGSLYDSHVTFQVANLLEVLRTK